MKICRNLKKLDVENVILKKYEKSGDGSQVIGPDESGDGTSGAVVGYEPADGIQAFTYSGKVLANLPFNAVMPDGKAVSISQKNDSGMYFGLDISDNGELYMMIIHDGIAEYGPAYTANETLGMPTLPVTEGKFYLKVTEDSEGSITYSWVAA